MSVLLQLFIAAVIVTAFILYRLCVDRLVFRASLRGRGADARCERTACAGACKPGIAVTKADTVATTQSLKRSA